MIDGDRGDRPGRRLGRSAAPSLFHPTFGAPRMTHADRRRPVRRDRRRRRERALRAGDAPCRWRNRPAARAASIRQGHRTFELGLREWVRAQTGFEPGYVEQLYTFGDLGRELPQAELGDAPSDARLISVGYLGLTPERTDISAFDAVWRDWHRYFPWEDHRKGRPEHHR